MSEINISVAERTKQNPTMRSVCCFWLVWTPYDVIMVSLRQLTQDGLKQHIVTAQRIVLQLSHMTNMVAVQQKLHKLVILYTYTKLEHNLLISSAAL